jgi:hypothetical protein
MRDLLRRLEKLEHELATGAECSCGGNLVVRFAGEPEPEQKECPQHGRQRVLCVEYIDWPLPRTALDA